MEVANHPVRSGEGGVKMVKDPVEVTLEGAAELIEVSLRNVTVRAAIAFAVRDAFEREPIEFFLRFKEVGVNGMGVLGC